MAFGSKFVEKVARRITGHYNEELESKGLPSPGGLDIIGVTAFAMAEMGTLVSTKDFFDSVQKDLPYVFST